MVPFDLDNIQQAVKSQLAENLQQEQEEQGDLSVSSDNYETFKNEQKQEFSVNSIYEKFCWFSEKYMGFSKAFLTKKTTESIAEEIEISGLNVTPSGVMASLFMTQVLALLLAMPFLLLSMLSATENILHFSFFIVCSGAFIGAVSYTYPGYRSEITKIISEQESLLAILYMTIYMRVNPIFENAMYFAAQHLNGPLGRDLKQSLWLLDNEKVGSMEQAIQYFIPLWVKRNTDFVKAILTLHSMLDQGDKEEQARILDKSLDIILASTYEKMKHYAHDLQMPVTILHTFGMMLPLIGLIAFPMMSIFMAESIKISYLFFGYIIILPALMFFFTRRIIAKRPGAFSYPDISNNPFVPPKNMYRVKIGENTYLIPVLMTALIVTFVLILPGIYQLMFKSIPAFISVKQGKLPAGVSVPPQLESEYQVSSVLMVLTIPLALALGIGIFYYGRSIQKLKIRNDVIEIEEDLSGALFQFAQQFTENIPIEDAVDGFIGEYVLLNLKKRSIFQFFEQVLDRITNEGVTFYQAIFDQRRGVIIRYPSVLLKEISWIISEGARKGSVIVHNILTKISTYLDNTKKIKELIYDLLTETVQSVNMQAKFMAPFIAAFVGSLSLVIIRALYQMAQRLDTIMNSLSFGSGGMSDSSFFSSFVNFTQIIPPTIFGSLVGVYMVQTVYLLSLLANGVENGFDEVSRDITIGRNMFTAIIVYILVSLIGTVALNHLITSGSMMVS